MRIWTLHPKYLDTKGLVALWRETLLAQKVLQDLTKGYKHHPQLIRFRKQTDPLGAISKYLETVWDEAYLRGYCFDKNKILLSTFSGQIEETRGQIEYEFEFLKKKLEHRDYDKFLFLQNIDYNDIEIHPLFIPVEGSVQDWEKVKYRP